MSEVRSCVLVAVLLTSSALSVHAFGEINSIRGELSCSWCSSYSDLVIEVQDSASNAPVGSFYVNSTGGFEMHGIQSGNLRRHCPEFQRYPQQTDGQSEQSFRCGEHRR